MNHKEEFTYTINELSGMPPMSECYNYGMTWVVMKIVRR